MRPSCRLKLAHCAPSHRLCRGSCLTQGPSEVWRLCLLGQPLSSTGARLGAPVSCWYSLAGCVRPVHRAGLPCSAPHAWCGPSLAACPVPALSFLGAGNGTPGHAPLGDKRLSATAWNTCLCLALCCACCVAAFTGAPTSCEPCQSGWGGCVPLQGTWPMASESSETHTRHECDSCSIKSV